MFFLAMLVEFSQRVQFLSYIPNKLDSYFRLKRIIFTKNTAVAFVYFYLDFSGPKNLQFKKVLFLF